MLFSSLRFSNDRVVRSLRPLVLCVFALLTTAAAQAAPIAIPNGDFSSAADNGVVGGGIVGGSGSMLIGAGPWHGSYHGVAGLLAPPTLTISTHRATIAGLAGIAVLGILDNDGDFEQSLGVSLLPNRHYVLKANLDAGVPLDVGLLNSSSAGIALTAGGTTVASTADGNTANISLELLSGTSYQLTLAYDTNAFASGLLGAELFAHPQNLVSANLLTSVTFNSVTLSSSVLNPVAASVGPGGGTPQGATVNTGFAAPLSVLVLDSEGDPVPNANVTFSVPASGASVLLSSTSAVTDTGGTAHVAATANGVAGSYSVSASVAGVAAPATFALTNLAGAPTSVTAALGTPQSALVNTPFLVPLSVLVLDPLGHAVGGISVTFGAPNSGPSASFAGSESVTTNLLGVATANAVANTVAGNYTVTAHVAGAAAASFDLTNVGGPASVVQPNGGTPQSAMVMTPFDAPLSVHLTDAFGNPKAAVAVAFTAPAIGPSATFPPAGILTTVLTDVNGDAQVAAVANATAGTYQITAQPTGLQAAVFNMTNTSGPVPHGDATSGSGQSANVGAAFLCQLQLKVTSDGTTPMSGVSIDFIAPASGPSATLSDGVLSGTTVTTATDVNGLTSVMATANATPGSYDISAGVTGSGTALATYQLKNLGAGERVFGDGFEGTPALCPGG